MKRVIFAVLLSLLLSLLPMDMAGVAADETNATVLLNGGFEVVVGAPKGWTVVHGSSSQIESSTDRAHSGDYSVKVNDPSDSGSIGLLSNKVAAVPGVTFEGSVFSYNEEGHSSLYLEFYDANGGRLDVVTGANETVDEWQQIKVEGTAPEGTAYVALQLYLNIGNVGTTYYDEASLVAIGEEADPVELVNGGFEDVVGTPKDWAVVHGSPSQIESSTDRVHSGDYSVKLTDPSDSDAIGLLSNKVPAVPGVAYEASVFSYNEKGSSSLYLEFLDANGDRLDVITSANKTTEEWKQINVTGTAPEGTASVALRLYLSVANVGIAYYDDATLGAVSLDEIYQKLIDRIRDTQDQWQTVSDKIPLGNAAPDQALRNEAAELEHHLESLTEQGEQADDAATLGRLIVEAEHVSLRIKRLDNFVGARNVRPESPFGLMTADAMALVYPKEIPCLCSTDAAELSLAKGEYESMQAVVMPYGEDLHNVRAEISSIVDPDGEEVSDSAIRAEVDPLGSVYVSNPGGFTLPALADRPQNYEGWLPDPIRSDLSQVDNVAAGDMQPFWIELYASEQAKAGTYQVTVNFSADGTDNEQLDIQAEVWPFEIPDQPELPTSMTMNPEIFEIVYGITDQEELDHMHQKYTDFLERFKIEQDLIYTGSPPTVEEVQKRQTKWGLRQFAAYYIYPGRLDLDLYDPDTWQPEIDRILDEIETAMAAYEEAGLADKAYVYGFDEGLGEQLSLAREVFGQIKEHFPDLPIMSTVMDRSLGVETGLADFIDIWVPGVETINHEARIEAQNRGDQVYWYTHQAVRDPLPNWFNGYAPSDTRVLLGPMSHKMNVDGFLYYNMTRWVGEGNSMPMVDGILSDWDPRTYPTTNGDGSLFYPGADGPLASQRIHNFRDGMEDYNLLNMLEETIARAEDAPEDLLAKARELLNADAIVTSESEYTKDPDRYRQWREAVAQMIIQLEAPKNVEAIQQLVEIFADEGEFANEQAVHALNLHLTAVGRFEQQEEAEKVIKHMQGFVLLLAHQRENDLITEEAYSVLEYKSETLIEQWR